MKFSEMILSTGPDETKSAFYESNNEQSREHFFNSMLEKTETELSNYQATINEFKPSEVVDEFSSLSNFRLASLKEKLSDLHKMKDQFIKTGYAKVGSYSYMTIFEQTLLRVS
ncbi:TPA: hypothetical protein ACJEU7_001506 [Acinetobacter baumannii]|uniref:hypothetical protein n=1 Tax=Acinetobacter baumannii TaxID=470 RepID=UPI00124A2F5E|nr:hypothetical protein [Acinetobacter baumannii]KAB1664934.1 hypothetical protein F8B05_19990 [Acinetobacter baumannii]MCX3035271.1 hypothetical protein [Acinetobacter baumannii]